MPRPLLFTRRSFSSTRKNCRSPMTPASVSSHPSTCWRASPFTGETEIQATRALIRRKLAAAAAGAVRPAVKHGTAFGTEPVGEAGRLAALLLLAAPARLVLMVLVVSALHPVRVRRRP